jgi:hypothetical protein
MHVRSSQEVHVVNVIFGMFEKSQSILIWYISGHDEASDV